MSASSSRWCGSTTRYASHSASAAARERSASRRGRGARRVSPPSGGRTARRRARGLAAAALHALVHRVANASSIGAPSSSTARIAAMRPRGDAISSPVTRYVGQCGRHSPHATHATSSSSSTGGARGARACGHAGPDLRSSGEPAAGASLPVGSNASWIRGHESPRSAARAEAVEAGAPGLAQQPAAAALRDACGRAERGVGRRPPTCTVPTPTSASHAHPASVEPRPSGRDRAGRDRDAAPVRVRRARRRAVDRAPRPRRAARSRRRRRRPRASTKRACAPSQSDARRPERAARGPSSGSRRRAPLPTALARGRQRSVTCTSTPSVPNEPTSRRGRS